MFETVEIIFFLVMALSVILFAGLIYNWILLSNELHKQFENMHKSNLSKKDM